MSNSQTKQQHDNSELDYQLTESQKAALNERCDDHVNGIGTTHSWEEALALAEEAFKQVKEKPTNL